MANAQQVVLTTPPSSSNPVTGSQGVTTGAVSPTFTPQLGRDMYLTLSGAGYTGTVQLQRSTDNGTTWNNVTYGGGQPWGLYTNKLCDEVIETPTDGASKYRLSIVINTGSVTYRLAQ